ncbi:hypothetical protein ACLOJK_018869 [Asimina triloba]
MEREPSCVFNLGLLDRAGGQRGTAVCLLPTAPWRDGGSGWVAPICLRSLVMNDCLMGSALGSVDRLLVRFGGAIRAAGCGWIGSLVWFDGGRLDLELKLERMLDPWATECGRLTSITLDIDGVSADASAGRYGWR